LLTPSYVNLKQSLLKPTSLPDCLDGSVVGGRVGGDGDGRGVVDVVLGGDVDGRVGGRGVLDAVVGGRVGGRVGGCVGGVGLLVGGSPLCMMLSGQSRLAEVHL
jgi:hypothetical protein